MRRLSAVFVLLSCLLLSGCLGGGGSDDQPSPRERAEKGTPVLGQSGDEEPAGPALGFPVFATKNTTRVGGGPFPTEMTGTLAESIRARGNEYGATTGRPRRCGWFDAVGARYAVRINGCDTVALTKLDVLTGLEKIPVAVAYDVDGQRFDELPVSQSDFHHAVPVYEEFPGWTEDISGARSFDELPTNAQSYVRELEAMSGSRISAIGVGPGREEIVQLHDLLP